MRKNSIANHKRKLQTQQRQWLMLYSVNNWHYLPVSLAATSLTMAAMISAKRQTEEQPGIVHE
jgi:hypothetical protein